MHINSAILAICFIGWIEVDSVSVDVNVAIKSAAVNEDATVNDVSQSISNSGKESLAQQLQEVEKNFNTTGASKDKKSKLMKQRFIAPFLQGAGHAIEGMGDFLGKLVPGR